VPSIARRLSGKNACEDPERSHRSKLRLGLFSAYHGPNGNGENALHGDAELVGRIGDLLATPIRVRRLYWILAKAQIVDLYYDGAVERALEIAIEWVRICDYAEAAPAGVTKARVGTECKFVDRRRESGREIYATRCTRTSHSAWAPWSTKPRKKKKVQGLQGLSQL
jgi:hypothetical protein